MTAVEPTTSVPNPALKSRRTMLCGLAVALLAPGALVAACSDDSSSTPPAENGGGGGGGSLAALEEVPDGGGLIVEGPDGQVLLVRTGDQVKAYNAACTHMGTIIDAPVDGVATCPNHGSEFNTEDGSVVKGPATSPLAEVAVRVDKGQVLAA